jgi:hypothetical protein
MTAEERALLETLDAIVGSEEIRAQIYPIVDSSKRLASSRGAEGP